MPTDLESIIADLSQAFPDHFLDSSLEERDPSDPPAPPMKVSLADFIVSTAAENYDTDSTAEANLLRIHTALQEAELLLRDVVERSRQLWRDSWTEPGG